MHLQKMWSVWSKATKLAHLLEVNGVDYTSQDNDGKESGVEKIIVLGGLGKKNNFIGYCLPNWL